jgi:hypothetical protein
MEKGQRKVGSGKEAQKRENTKRRAQVKKITKMAKVRVLFWNVAD